MSRLPAREKILAAVYSMFLLWQMAALIPYMIHTIDCCFHMRKVSFQCKQSSIPYLAEIELAMVISIDMNMIFCLWFLRKIPYFLGYKKIFKKLSHVPAFWSLVVLLVVLLTGLTIIQLVNDRFAIQSALFLAFVCHAILIVALVGTLNYTQIKLIRVNYPFFVFVLSKATLVKIFTENCVLFLMGTMQLTFGVKGLNTDQSAILQTTFGVVRQFSVGFFCFKVSAFLWQKIFEDNRNILSYHDHLADDSETQDLLLL